MSERLIEQARRGDADAFVALIEARQDRMTRVAAAILGNRVDADDALQETLVAIWRGLPRLRSAGQFDAWADRILVNACRLVLRRRGRRSFREVRPAGPDVVVSALPSALDLAVAADRFSRAFAVLDAEARALLVFRHLEDRSITDIAAVLQIPEGTAKSRLFTARRALEAALAEIDR